MRVLFVPSWFPTDSDPYRGDFFERHRDALCLRHDVEVVVPPRGAGIAVFIEATYRAARRVRPHVIHAHVAVPAGLAATVVGLALGIPVVVTEHSGPLRRLYGSSRWRRLVVRSVFERAAAVIAPSATLGRELGALDIGALIHLVPNPVGGLPRPSPDPTPFQFVSVGFMDDRTKGFEHLLAAWAEFASHRSEARLWLIGGGVLEQEYRRIAQELGVDGSVTFCGLVRPEETLRRIAVADAYVSSSVHESFGFAVAQAAALGRPLIATAVGCAPDFALPQYGILVRPGDADALARALERFAATRSEFNRDGLRVHALKRLSLEAVADATTAVYEDVIERARRRVGS